MTLEWKDPPPGHVTGHGHRDWWAIAAELRARPGEWAIVAHDTDPSMVTQIKRGRYAAMAVGEFEAVSRRFEKGNARVDVWARYVGGVTGE